MKPRRMGIHRGFERGRSPINENETMIQPMKLEAQQEDPETLFKGLAALEKFLTPHETRWQLETLIDEAVAADRMTEEEGNDAKQCLYRLKATSLAAKLSELVRTAWACEDRNWDYTSGPELTGTIKGSLAAYGDYPVTYDRTEGGR